MHRRQLIIVAAVAVLASSALAGCQVARVGTRCRSNGTAQDATHVLVCKKGRWVRLISKADGLRFLAAKRAAVSTTTAAPPPAAAPAAPTTTTPPPPPPAYDIAAGYQRTCAVMAGVVKCLGNNTDDGLLGDGTTTDSMSFVSTGITDGAAVSSGSVATCAIRSGGTVWCWGYSGYLGRSSAGNSAIPVQAEGISGATQIASGSNGSCALISDGTVRCWGQNPGDGVTAFAAAPVTAAISSVVKIAVGGSHRCALKADGSVWCWGTNGSGQLGNGTSTPSSTPVQVSGLTNAVDIAAGGFNPVSCAAKADGTAWCWGDDAYRMLGDGDPSIVNSLTPSQVVGLSDVRKISTGFYASCAVRAGGGVSCWGSGGSLGDGTSDPSASPVEVTAVINAVSIDSSGPNTCVLQSGNTAACWGSNVYGALGGGTATPTNYAVGVIGMP